MSSRVSRSAVGYFALSLTMSGVVGWIGQPFVHGNKEALALLATMFSVLAGFLVAILTLLGDPALLPWRTWRGRVLARKPIVRRLKRYRLLFLVYLLTLALVFISLLVDSKQPRVTLWLERAYLFLGCMGFAYSLRLPWALSRIQEERIDAEIQRARKKSKLGDPAEGEDG